MSWLRTAASDIKLPMAGLNKVIRIAELKVEGACIPTDKKGIRGDVAINIFCCIIHHPVCILGRKQAPVATSSEAFQLDR